ncbi:MAG TPA: hypothetical protein VHD56_08645 [Tepidisphaeraceae bacterium]|nr:hypothetical protein [Tepidisphaeraceae bacterium]
MVGKFAYSFDRETFDGAFETRQEALKQAQLRLAQMDSDAQAIYVGKRVAIDPGSSGLAEMILGAMRRRVRTATGDNSSNYLMRVNEHQLAELDDQIDSVVRNWMNKHELAPTQSRIISISEYPVQQPSMSGASQSGNEVFDLGEG